MQSSGTNLPAAVRAVLSGAKELGLDWPLSHELLTSEKIQSLASASSKKHEYNSTPREQLAAELAFYDVLNYCWPGTVTWSQTAAPYDVKMMIDDTALLFDVKLCSKSTVTQSNWEASVISQGTWNGESLTNLMYIVLSPSPKPEHLLFRGAFYPALATWKPSNIGSSRYVFLRDIEYL